MKNIRFLFQINEHCSYICLDIKMEQHKDTQLYL
jgi:hypothetical protein